MKYISNIIVYLIHLLHRIDAKVTNFKSNPNPNFYEDLAPIDNVEDTNYIESLEWSLRNKKINNIALTAPYGAGKSSILRTFEKNHKQYYYLNISLATFKDDGDLDNASIEKSILQQMFYKVKSKEIPQSRFKRIINSKYLYLKTFFTFGWLLSAFVLFKAEMIKNMYLPDGFNVLAFFIFLVGSFIVVYKLLNSFTNMKLHKISLQSPEIEIDNDSDVSILNKHLDEILYFFEVTKYDVVVIEDLDRFQKPEIFTKLRELNALINNSEQICRRIVFIYAIRDNMFKDENRTKFFDFMIPVIPIINSSNSVELLQKKIQQAALSNVLSEIFINDIALYISDMRMLKNVYNEFMLYKNKLSKIGIDLNKLFAMILYKNIYPSDFADLHDNKGMVFNIFANKKKVAEKSLQKTDAEIDKLKQHVQILETQALNNIHELRAVYIQEIMEKIPNIQKISLNSRELTFAQVKEDSVFNQLKQQNNIQYYKINHGYLNSNISFQSIENGINQDLSYDDRENFILEKEENKLEDLKEQIEDKQKLKRTMKLATIKEHIENFGEKDVFDETILKEKLLVYLIRHGYIDEMYHSFISYFFEGSITKEDMDFVLSIKNQDSLGFEYKLVEIKALLKKIRMSEFSQEEILNYDLLNFIFENKDAYHGEFEALISQVSNEKEKSVQFIDGYLQYGKYSENFIKSIAHKWNGLWKYIETQSNFSEEKKNSYLTLICKFVDINDIIAMNLSSNLSKYIAKKSNFLSLISEEEYVHKIQQIISSLDIKFDDIENSESTDELFQYIYENDFYKINAKMINLILNQEQTESSQTSHYTTILNSDKTHLQTYVNKNIETYIENVFVKLDINYNESVDAILALLNNDDISQSNKEKIIAKENAILASITEVPESLWRTLFQENKIQATWQNVLYFHQDKDEFDIDLINFLNIEANYLQLSESKLKSDEVFDDDFIKHISKSILLSLDISDACFQHLIKSIPYTYNSLDFKELSEEKIKIMVETDFLNLTAANFDLLKNSFSNFHITLVERHIDEFIETQNDFTIDELDIIVLFKSNTITSGQKVIILNALSTDVITDDISTQIFPIILSNDINEKLQFETIETLFRCDTSIENKLDIFTKYMSSMNEENITTLLTELGNPFDKLTEKGRHPTVPLNEHTKKFIEKLDEINYISSATEEGKKLRIHTNKS